MMLLMVVSRVIYMVEYSWYICTVSACRRYGLDATLRSSRLTC